MTGAITIDTRATAPISLTGDLHGARSGGSLGNFPATVSVTTAAQHGAVTVSGTTLNYTITDAAFFAGTDVFSYTITDNDGETDSAEVTVTIADLAARPSRSGTSRQIRTMRPQRSPSGSSCSWEMARRASMRSP